MMLLLACSQCSIHFENSHMAPRAEMNARSSLVLLQRHYKASKLKHFLHLIAFVIYCLFALEFVKLE